MRSERRPKWHPQPEAQARRNSAIAAIRAILNAKDVIDTHRVELLSVCLWKLTEADGKYTTRFCSRHARDAGPEKLAHDHVWQRRALIDKLMTHPDDVLQIVENAIGCTVTREEHQRLTSEDRRGQSLEGWVRYAKAKIEVIDNSTGERLALPTLTELSDGSLTCTSGAAHAKPATT